MNKIFKTRKDAQNFIAEHNLTVIRNCEVDYDSRNVDLDELGGLEVSGSTSAVELVNGDLIDWFEEGGVYTVKFPWGEEVFDNIIDARNRFEEVCDLAYTEDFSGKVSLYDGDEELKSEDF